jgi:hypothetical protein
MNVEILVERVLSSTNILAQARVSKVLQPGVKLWLGATNYLLITVVQHGFYLYLLSLTANLPN